MRAFFSSRWFPFGLRVAVGLVFAYAGAVKLLRPLDFADSIATFELLPNAAINLLALTLPPFEILVGVMLLFGLRVRLASFAVLSLSVVFLFALGQALARGLEVDCGCFGSGPPSDLKAWASVGRAALLLASGMFLYRTYSKQGSSSTVRRIDVA